MLPPVHPFPQFQHLRYFDTKSTVCDFPERLDTYDTPIVKDRDAIKGSECRECLALLMAHTNKAEEGLIHDHNFSLRDEDPLSPARGVMIGLLVATMFWATVALLFWILSRG